MDTVAAYAARHPDRAALIEGERRLTWGELLDRRLTVTATSTGPAALDGTPNDSVLLLVIRGG